VALRLGKSSFQILWERNDLVWPAAASAEEAEAYRDESSTK